MAHGLGIRIGAWATHALTASGMLVGYLALDSFTHLEIPGADRAGWLWLLLALLIDGVDGTFARRFRVKEVLPGMDGGMIDAVVDFANYVLIPTFFIGRGGHPDRLGTLLRQARHGVERPLLRRLPCPVECRRLLPVLHL
jgi:phosphatidylcholine synthase